MATEKERLDLIALTADLLRTSIRLNGGRYDGNMVPNLQSIIDLTSLDGDVLGKVEGLQQELSRINAKINRTQRPVFFGDEI